MQINPSWMVHVGVGQFIIYVVPLLLLGSHFTQPSPASGKLIGFSRTTLRRAYLALLVVTMLAAVLMVGRILWRTILYPPGWDFQGLWLYGKIVDAGQNPYLPASFHALAGPGPFVNDFKEQVVDVGAVYPPPSLVFFGTIGFLPMKVAIVPWMILQLAAFVAMIVLLRKTFFRREGWEEWALVLTLALLLPGTISTFGQAQVNFIAVLCVIAAWRSRDRAASGIYLVIAAVMKLLYGFLWLYPVLRRRLKPLYGIAVAGSVSILVSIVTLGWKAVATYLFDNPVTHRMPSYYFVYWANPSLIAGVFRLFPYHRPAFGPPLGHPAFIAGAALIGLITMWTVVRLPGTPEGEDIAFILLLLAGMLIYPWTLANYFVIMLVPMGLLWMRRNESPLGVGGTIILLSILYPVTGLSKGAYCLLATILLWITTCALAVHTIRATSRKVQSNVALPIAPST